MGHGPVANGATVHGDENSETHDDEKHRLHASSKSEAPSALVMTAPCLCGCGSGVMVNLAGRAALQKVLIGGSIDWVVREPLGPSVPVDRGMSPLNAPSEIDHIPIV